MKVCARCSFSSPDKAVICMTCGGIKLIKAASPLPLNENKTENFSSTMEEFFYVIDGTARNKIGVIQSEIAILLPKLSSAYRKIVALATLKDFETMKPQYTAEGAPQAAEENQLNFAPHNGEFDDTMFQGVSSNQLEELRAKLESSKLWFQNYGSAGLIADFSPHNTEQEESTSNMDAVKTTLSSVAKQSDGDRGNDSIAA